MILYNVTVKIDPARHEEGYTWMVDQHIPDVLKTGCFTGYRVSKILGKDESDGITYSIQYSTPDMKTLHKYQVQFAPALQADHTERFQGHFVAFRTLMEVVNES